MIRIFTIIIMVLLMFSVPASAQMFNEGYDDFTPKQEEQKEEPKLEISTVERGPLYPGDMYYYDKEKNRTYPQMSNWKFAVMFEMPISKENIKELVKTSKSIVNAYVLEAQGMPYTCVIFEIDKKSEQDVFELINVFNKIKSAKFASPVFVINGKEHVFSGLFEIRVKEQPDNPGQMEDSKTIYGMLNALEISKEGIVEGRERCWTYKVHPKENGRNFFQIINFLAEDPRIVYAAPIFTSITPLVEIVQEVELKGAKIGSRIPYKVTIRKDPRVKIDPSVLTNLKISQTHMIHKLDPYDPKQIIEGTEIVITGYVQFFMVGEQTIDPRKVSYILEENGKMVKGEVVSNEIIIKIASLIPEECEDGIIAKAPLKKYSAEKIINSLKKDRNFAAVLGLASIILCLIAIIKFSTWIARDMKSRKGKETANPLTEAVESLKNAVSSAKDKDYAQRVDSAVRNWLSIKTGNDFRTGTVNNIKDRLELLDKRFAEEVSEALEKCEEIMSREQSDSQTQTLTLELEKLASKLVTNS